MAMVKVSKLLGSNINPNPNYNSALTLIDGSTARRCIAIVTTELNNTRVET